MGLRAHFSLRARSGKQLARLAAGNAVRHPVREHGFSHACVILRTLPHIKEAVRERESVSIFCVGVVCFDSDLSTVIF